MRLKVKKAITPTLKTNIKNKRNSILKSRYKYLHFNKLTFTQYPSNKPKAILSGEDNLAIYK